MLQLPLRPNRLKTASCLILGIALLWACAGGGLWHTARTLHYRWTRAEDSWKVKDTITIAPGQSVQWMEHDELRYEGRMFDVKDRWTRGDALVLAGHFDETDDELFGLLRRMMEGDENDESGEQTRLPFFPEATGPVAAWCPRGWQPPALRPRFPPILSPLRSAAPAPPEAPPKRAGV